MPRVVRAAKSSGGGESGVDVRRLVAEEQVGLGRRPGGMEPRGVEGKPRCPSARSMPGDDVSAATISIRPLRRAHSRTCHGGRRPRSTTPREGPTRHRRRGRIVIVVRSCTGPGDLRPARGDDGGAAAKAGAKTPKYRVKVGARAGNERDKALDELVRREYESGRAVAPGALELELESAVVEAGEPIGGDRRAREIARHALDTRAIGGGDSGGRLEVEAADLGAEPTVHDGVHVRGRTSNANDVPTAGGASGNHAPRRGAGNVDDSAMASRSARKVFQCSCRVA